MKYSLSTLLLTISIYSFSQNVVDHDAYLNKPTVFDAFTSSPTISWAAKTTRNYHFNTAKFSLWDYLFEKWYRGTLPIYWYGNNEHDNDDYVPFDDDSVINRLRRVFKNGIKAVDSSDKYIRANQVFYVQNNQLKSFIFFASLSLPVVLNSGEIISFTPLFYSCINTKPTDNINTYTDMIDLGIDSIKYIVNPNDAHVTPENSGGFNVDEIKRTYNQDLGDKLWRLALDNKVTVIDIRNNKVVPADSLKNYTVYPDFKQYRYDEHGNVLDSEFIKRPVYPSFISSIDIIQHFYFDKSRDQLFSTIQQAYVLISVPIDLYPVAIRETRAVKIIFDK